MRAPPLSNTDNTMESHSISEHPGLRIEHLRQLVRLRRASGWLGILAFTGLLALRGMDHMDPDLFRAALPEHHAFSTPSGSDVRSMLVKHHPHKLV